jgi:hypothetical protein
VEQAASKQDARLLAHAREEADDLEEARTALLPGTARRVIDNLWSEQLTSQQPTERP